MKPPYVSRSAASNDSAAFADAATHAQHDDDDARPLDRAVAREAAQWLVRLADNPTPDDLAACSRWRAADPEHARAWRRAERLNAKLRAMPANLAMPALARAGRREGGERGASVTNATNSTSGTRRSALKALTVLLAAGPSAYLAWRATPWRVWTADARTATGERRTLVLDDGTRVELNTATALDVAFDAHERRVRLDAGEIFVETAPDRAPDRANIPTNPGRPFIVQTADGRIRALGTRFVVRQLGDGLGNGDDNDAGTHVAVLHGAVEITPADAPHLTRVVNAGEQTRFTARSIDALTPADPHAADWTQGVLFADHVRLADFLTEIGRYRSGLLRCDPAVADLRISGAFQLADTDSLLTALPATLPVQVVWRTRYWVTVAAAPAAPAVVDNTARREST
ncbi:FecR family protein [Paraburkholderia tropica]|nr:FecR family protein [Paraburkholderia tropica]